MKHSELDKKIKAHMANYKIEALGVFKDGVWRGNEYGHILPNDKQNLLPMAEWPNDITHHDGSAHLNSSQAMCVNFFSPLCADDEGKEILLKIICKVTGFKFLPNSQIVCCEFEKNPNKTEKTSVDFYIKLDNEQEIFFEIKYSESEFGSANSKTTDYSEQFEKTYKSMCNSSVFLKNISEDFFINHYQICRNIVLVQNEKQYACFVYPFVSETLKKKMDDKELEPILKQDKDHVAQLDWVNLCTTAKELTENSKDTKYYFHYHLFQQKYIMPLI